eukprot:scaffold7007_cov75-Cylindrotheca_fusiformis.AAC.1
MERPSFSRIDRPRPPSVTMDVERYKTNQQDESRDRDGFKNSIRTTRIAFFHIPCSINEGSGNKSSRMMFDSQVFKLVNTMGHSWAISGLLLIAMPKADSNRVL